MEEEIEIVIDTDEIEEFLLYELVQKGYAPGKREVEDIADILFEYLVNKKSSKRD